MGHFEKLLINALTDSDPPTAIARFVEDFNKFELEANERQRQIAFLQEELMRQERLHALLIIFAALLGYLSSWAIFA